MGGVCEVPVAEEVESRAGEREKMEPLLWDNLDHQHV